MVKQTQPPVDNSGGSQKPLLQITLPAHANMKVSDPVTIGEHNSCAQKNFKQVANIFMVVINNQKLMGLAITQQDKKLKKLQKNMKTISDNIKKLLNDNKK